MINIPKGTRDVLPKDSAKWQRIESAARETAGLFGFGEIRTPVFEYTELFQRGVGGTTDIVNKEMYTFPDRGGRSLTLKPEGTAGAVRAFIENGLSSGPLPLKVYYITPAFRYERPQAGRLREFHQFGLEAFGSAEPWADAEVIIAAQTFLEKTGIKSFTLEINSIGCRECRHRYNEALREYFRPRLGDMCELCRDRFGRNPLRILDCKNPECGRTAAGAPKITDYLCDGCRAHFEAVQGCLRQNGIAYRVNPSIVRGLDYYSRTVFEFVSDDIGAQGTICGGGRYDGLVSELGGADTPAIGFAAGIERLLLLLENTGADMPDTVKPLVYIGGTDDVSRAEAFRLANGVRAAGGYAETDLMGRSVKAQLKYADRIGAKYAVMIGENETASGFAEVKKMSDGTSERIKLDALTGYLIKNRGE